MSEAVAFRGKMTFTLGLAVEADLAALPSIERLAASRFEGYDVPLAVLVETTPVEDFRASMRDGLLWIARAEGDEPIGFAQVIVAGGTPHLEEIDVLPAHGRRGVGRALVEEVCAWAARAGHDEVTLTTYRHIPWNMPFYERLGFDEMPGDEMSTGLRDIVREEAERGLDPATRVVMRRRLTRSRGHE